MKNQNQDGPATQATENTDPLPGKRQFDLLTAEGYKNNQDLAGNMTDEEPLADSRLWFTNTIENGPTRKKIKLQRTLETSKVEQVQKYHRMRFLVPAWVNARLVSTIQPQIIYDFLTPAPWVNDPIQGRAAREIFLARWARVMEFKDTWIHRDKQPVVEIEFGLCPSNYSWLGIAERFLGVRDEIILVAVLAAHALQVHAEAQPRVYLWEQPLSQPAPGASSPQTTAPA